MKMFEMQRHKKNLARIGVVLLFSSAITACGDISTTSANNLPTSVVAQTGAASANNAPLGNVVTATSAATPTATMTAVGAANANTWPATTPLKAQPTSQITPNASPAFVSSGIVSTTQYGISWRQLDAYAKQPTNNLPMAVSNSYGTLWIKFPSFVSDGLGAASGSHPTEAYQVFYTASTAQNDLSKDAQKLFTIPKEENAKPPYKSYNYVNQITAATDNHFLISTYSGSNGSQNGGKTQIWWVEPRTKTFKLVFSGSGVGGGKFLIVAQNEKWLFLNEYRDNAPTFNPPMTDAHAFLVNLQNGQRQEISLGKDNWTQQAEWNSSGKLLFQTETSQRVLDPVTGQIADVTSK